MADSMFDLTGHLLIAMPGMSDPRFTQSVIFLAAHSEDGAMGLIVNRPAEGVTLAEVLEQLTVEMPEEGPGLGVHVGGPVETGRGFVLHSLDYRSAMQTLEVEGGFGLTATLDVLEDIVIGRGPSEALLMLGYAGWGPGQLEGELAMNGWLTCRASRELVFGLPDDDKWAAAVKTIGVDPTGLSAAAGRA